MKRILSSLFVALTLLLVGGAFTTSCSNEILSTQQVDNTPRAFTIKLSAGFELPEIKELDSIPGTRAVTDKVDLIFQIQDSKKRKVTYDDGKPSNTSAKFAHLNRTLVVERYQTMKFLTVIRAKNRKEVVYYDYSEWKYDKATNCWIKEAISIPLSAGFALNDEIEVRLAAGGEITVADVQKSADIKVTPTIHQEVHFNSPEAQKMELPIPYISDWHDLTYDDNTTAMILASGRNNKIPVKPQGILMLASVRNNMSIPVTLGGIRIKSNALDYGGTFNLAGDDVQFTENNEGLDVRITKATKDVYKNLKIMFKQPLNLRANMGEKSDIVLVLTWAYPRTEKFLDRSWDKGGSNFERQLFGQVHIYAEKVFDESGQEVTKPNYEMVPIMGTSNILRSGYSYTFNCELYDQPNLLLGYFAKYTVNEKGDGFDNSHDHASASLVNWTVAKEFINGKQLTTADGITGKHFMMPYAGGAMVLASGGWGGFGTAHTSMNAPAPYNGQLYAVGGNDNRKTMQFNYNGYTSDANTAIQSYLNPQKTIGYRITNRWTLSTKSLKRDLPQVVWRYEIETKLKSETTYITYPKVSSIYVGKYFVGGLFTPVYRDLCLVDEELWQSPVGRRNIVERKFPVPGLYKTVNEGELENEVPADKTRIDVGIKTNYWIISDEWYTNNIMGQLKKSPSGANQTKTGQNWIDEVIANGARYRHCIMTPSLGAPSNGGEPSQPRLRTMLFQPLITYSNVYQGDTAD